MSTTIASSIRKLDLSALLFTLIVSSLPAVAAPSTVEIVGRPQLEDDKVTVRVSVKDEDNDAVVDLQSENFLLKVDDNTLGEQQLEWTPPGEAPPPPAWIVVLLDMSNSMKAPDSQGTTKLEGAVSAIEQFRNSLIERTANTPIGAIPKISIVPFGIGNDIPSTEAGSCSGFNATAAEIDSRFLAVDDSEIEQDLAELRAYPVCASTDIYNPVREAVQLLGNEADRRFYVPEGFWGMNRTDPRLMVILLSDGYHTEGPEPEEFDRLSRTLQQNPDVIVHTLGYGETPEQLGQLFKLGRPATRDDVVDINGGIVPAERFVDQERLAEIASATGGIAEFSGNAETVVARLQQFLNELLGTYEISYIQPNAVRGSQHTVQAEVSASEEEPLRSEPVKFKIRTYSYRALPRKTRASVFAATLLSMGALGVWPFWQWARKLKADEM